MSEASWRVDEPEQEPLAAVPSSPALVTLHFLVAALRRSWRVWVGLGCVGMLLGLAWALASPPKSVGSVTLVLAHETTSDPQQAMLTDVSLLRTRTLAVDVVDRLGLDMTPEAFQQSMVGVPETTDVLVLQVSGPDDPTAVERTRALATAYLSFRSTQLRDQLEALNRGYEKRVRTLRAQAEALQKEYDRLTTDSPGAEQTTAAIVNRQAQISTEIESIQRSVRETSLKTNSIIDASKVLDPAASKPRPSLLKSVLLAMASGLIGATAVGVGLVLSRALLSDRLRLREEVALALGTPVRVSVGGLRARRHWWQVRQHQDASDALDLVVDALEEEITRARRSRPSRPARLALGCVDNPRTGRLVTEGLMDRLGAAGLDVFVLDLSATGDLAAAHSSAPPAQETARDGRRPVVHRPDRVPSLVQGPGGQTTGARTELQSAEARDEAPEHADVVLALVDVDPAMGVEHLAAWVDDMVVLVTAGRSSAERLRTTGELIRSAGLRLRFAVLVGSDHLDESLGAPAPANDWRDPGRVS